MNSHPKFCIISKGKMDFVYQKKKIPLTEIVMLEAETYFHLLNGKKYWFPEPWNCLINCSRTILLPVFTVHSSSISLIWKVMMPIKNVWCWATIWKQQFPDERKERWNIPQILRRFCGRIKKNLLSLFQKAFCFNT